MNPRRVLCVHEGPGLNKLCAALESAGYEAVPAHDGGTALDVLSSQHVDGVVLDFDTEAPGGYSLRGRIHHHSPDMPMLLFDTVEDIEHLPLHVFRSYLQNPEAPDAIFAHIYN